MENKRLTRNQDNFWGKDNYRGEKYIIGSDGVTSKQMCLNKLGKIEDLMEKYEIESIEELELAIKDFKTNKDIFEMATGLKLKPKLNISIDDKIEVEEDEKEVN